MLEFETTTSRLQAVIPNKPKIILALQLLKAINVDEVQRRTIIPNIKFDISNEDVYEELNSSIRLLNGSLAEKCQVTRTKVKPSMENKGATKEDDQDQEEDSDPKKEEEEVFRNHDMKMDTETEVDLEKKVNLENRETAVEEDVKGHTYVMRKI